MKTSEDATNGTTTTSKDDKEWPPLEGMVWTEAMKRFRFALAASVLVSLATIVACGSGKSRASFTEEPPVGNADAGDFLDDDASLTDGAPNDPLGGRDPKTCQEATTARSYVGCDYWPTVTANLVDEVFDFAVAVANVGEEDANVEVTGPNGVHESVTVASGDIGKIYLPWVESLKGGTDGSMTASVLEKKGAYHLVSDKPVVVYQFNPLEFRAEGGEPGKDWSSCEVSPTTGECYSYSNDASLLLPSTAMTGTYRIMGSQGFSRHPQDPFTGELLKDEPIADYGPAYVAVTATEDGTNVTVKLGSKAAVVAGGSISATAAGGTLTLTLDAGDVAELVTGLGQNYDFSGSLLTADKPVQVITGVPCMDEPFDVRACDHIEETVFPAETLGKHYVVARPTGPIDGEVGHVVRFYGNVDGTTLTYTPKKPSGCPDTLSAGEFVECGIVTKDFEVSGSAEFGVGMFQLGGEKVDTEFDPDNFEQPQGDPSQSFAVTVEQYRKRYVFLAPPDYKKNFVDVVAEEGTKLTLDGKDVSSSLDQLTGTSWYVARIKLSSSNDGVHTLEADKPIGIQVLGYGDNTSYQYPGGLNLGTIAPPPVN